MNLTNEFEYICMLVYYMQRLIDNYSLIIVYCKRLLILQHSVSSLGMYPYLYSLSRVTWFVTKVVNYVHTIISPIVLLYVPWSCCANIYIADGK